MAVHCLKRGWSLTVQERIKFYMHEKMCLRNICSMEEREIRILKGAAVFKLILVKRIKVSMLQRLDL